MTGGEDGELYIDSSRAAEFFSDDESAGRIAHRREGSRLLVWIEDDGLFQPTLSGHGRIGAPFCTDLVVQTSSGRVLVDGVGAGTCSVRTVSGGIRVSRVRGSLSVDSVSGSIDIEAAEGGVKAHSVSGSIAGRLLKLTDDSAFSSVSGNIQVGLDSSLETLAFDLKSVSGRITVGSIRAERGLRMGFGTPVVRGYTVSGALSFK